MTTGVHGFDGRLSELIAQQADKSGITSDAYIRRAVVDRLVGELEHDENSAVGQLIRHLRAENEGSDGPSPVSERRFNTPIDDPARLDAVERTGLMHTPDDGNYDRIVAMAADALSVPAAGVALLDANHQFFLGGYGLPPEVADTRLVPIEGTICRYTIDEGSPLVVEDTRLHEILKDHPAVKEHELLSYLGIPLEDADGQAVGTLCVWDQQPRQWTTGHIQTLQDLAWIAREKIFG